MKGSRPQFRKTACSSTKIHNESFDMLRGEIPPIFFTSQKLIFQKNLVLVGAKIGYREQT